ncbi:MAG: enoyl-CoA hydratase/isomerase family protein [Myxococcales bacterium]|nr:enoyl-CoA hydratase/isomerase family protein [Myxococcales bacterium]
MSARTPAVLTLDLAEALDRLGELDFVEACSPLTGSGLLVVRLAGDAPVTSPERLEAALAGLVRLPCPTLGLLEAASPEAQALAERVDVRVKSVDEVEVITGCIERSPCAALSLVQLLRHSETLDIEGGLMAESWVYSTLQAGPEFQGWLKSRSTTQAPPANPEPAVLMHREGNTLQLRLNRPEKHNAFSAAMRDGLCEGLQLVLRDDSIKAVILSGAGRSFSSGGDLDEFGSLPDPATAHVIRSTRNVARLLAACGDRVRAEVHGACVGAGIELPAFVSRIVAKPDSWFQLPEVQMGLVPGAGGTVSLPRRIGRQRTAWLALSGERLDAQRALDWGLIDELR